MTSMQQLQRAAQAAQAALGAAQAEQAAAAKAQAEEQRQRSIAWAFHAIVSYPGRLAAANGEVNAALAAFTTAIESDYGTAPARYLDIIRAQARGNAAAAEFTKARYVLREAGILPPGQPNRPDPTGMAAPFPTVGMAAFPSFEALAASTLAAATAVAARLPPSAEDPAGFEGQASEAMKRGVLANEFTVTAELEHMLGYRQQHPEHYAKNVPADQKTATAAYEACRLAAGYDGKLPKVVVSTSGREEERPFASNELVRIRLYSEMDGRSPR